MDIDLLDRDFFQGDPHPAFTWMRANQPVYRDETNQLWGISRHADVLDVERRAEVFSSKGCYRALVVNEELNMIAQDDPEHLAQRRLVNRRFTPRSVRDHTEEFDELVGQLIDSFIGDGRVEVIDAVAGRLPAILTCRFLGLPDDEWPMVKGWSERLMRIDSREQGEAEMMEFLGANMELYQRVMAEVPAREGDDGDDLLSVWAREYDGVDRVFHEAGLFVSGGSETTRTVIAHALRTFCDHNDQWEMLAADPALVPTAVEEIIRWVTPLNNMFRTCLQDTTVGGTEIKAGDRLMLIYPSANRDEDVFDEPFRFDITRDPNPHIAFGHGTHFCLGANFARTELQILFRELAARLTNLRPITEPDVEPNVFARAVRNFDLGFDKR